MTRLLVQGVGGRTLVRSLHNTNKPANLTARTASLLKSWQIKAVSLLQRVNDATGYSEIERIKQRIAEMEIENKRNREIRTQSLAAYHDAIADRTTSQQEVNELLHRKNDWSSHDIERFTQLYRQDHEIEQRVERTKKETAAAEAKYEASQASLGQLISNRYREEQIWSDRVRQFSTWGTVVLMAFNVLLFLIVQLGLEPWKRRRLVGAFENKVKAVLDAKTEPVVEIEPLEVTSVSGMLNYITIKPLELLGVALGSLVLGIFLGTLR